MTLQEELAIGTEILASYKKNGDVAQKLVAFIVAQYGVSGLSEAIGLPIDNVRGMILHELPFDNHVTQMHAYAKKLYAWYKNTKEEDDDDE